MQEPVPAGPPEWEFQDVYAIGGWDGTEWTQSVEKYNYKEGTWEECASTKTRRFGGTACVLDGYTYAVGGWGRETALQRVERFDLNKKAWQYVPSMDTKREGCSAAVV